MRDWGLRQKRSRSARNWRPNSPVAVTASDPGPGRRLVRAGQPQVDVLQRRAADGQVRQHVAALQGPGGQRVQNAGRVGRAEVDAPIALLGQGGDLRWQLRQLGACRQRKGDVAVGVVAAAQRPRRSLGDDLTGHYHGDPVGQRLCLVHVVRGQEDRLAEGAQVGDDLPGVMASRRVKAGRGLIQEHQLGITDQRQCDIESAQLPSGELPRPGVTLLGQAHELDRLGHRTRVRGAGVRRTGGEGGGAGAAEVAGEPADGQAAEQSGTRDVCGGCAALCRIDAEAGREMLEEEMRE